MPVSAPQHQHLRLPDSPEGHAEVSGAAVPTVHEQKDPDGSRWKSAQGEMREPVGWSGTGWELPTPLHHPAPPHPPPPSSLPPPTSLLPATWLLPSSPPAPPGHRGPSLGVQFHRGVSHTYITDKGRPVPPKMELILCGPPPIPPSAQTLQGGPRPPDRTPTRLSGRTFPGLRGDLPGAKGRPVSGQGEPLGAQPPHR